MFIAPAAGRFNNVIFIIEQVPAAPIAQRA
jgi:hypothetical protein